MLPESDKKDEDLNRWVEEQLKARGLNPQDLSLEQMLALMQPKRSAPASQRQ